MSKKICHLTSVHPPYDIRIFHKECRSLAKKGWETYLVTTEVESQERDGVHVVGVSRQYKGRLGRMFSTARMVAQKGYELDADIYHIHDPELLPFALILKKMGKKTIYDAHEDLPKQTLSKEYIPLATRKTFSWSLKHVENFIARRMDAVVAATPSIARRFQWVNKTIVNINNFPFAHELGEGKSSVLKEKVVCYVGGIAETRGIFEMVRAIAKVKDSRLVLAGSISESIREELVNEPGWKNVDYLGTVDRSGVAEAMARSLVGMVVLKPVPNHIEALPIKLFEYLSAGLPIIASDFPLWREMLEEHNCAIFVDPNEVDQIAEAIQWVIDHPAEAVEMGQRGKKLIETKYNWENEEKKLLSLYDKLSNDIQPK